MAEALPTRGPTRASLTTNSYSAQGMPTKSKGTYVEKINGEEGRQDACERDIC
jgi:hypothetical protein